MSAVTLATDTSRDGRRLTPSRVALLLLLAVITVLFGLIALAYGIRARMGDWQPMPLPWQVLLNTAILMAASLCWHQAQRATTIPGEPGRQDDMLRWAGWLSIAFVAGQGWGWWQLQAAGYVVQGNPANSFFYLFTGLHAVHLAGGLFAWFKVCRRQLRVDEQHYRQLLALCCLYWHFLLGLWLVILVLLMFVLPETPPWALPGDASMFCASPTAVSRLV